MKKYTICFQATGGIDIVAKNADEAIRKFNEEIDQNDIIENLTENGWDITEVFTEDDGLSVQEAIDYMMDGHLPNCVFDGEVIVDGDQLLCSTESVADLVANYIDELCDDEVSHTGYYDPEEDERSGEADNHTGWWYVDFD